MTRSSERELGELIGQLDPGAQLRLRVALVRQAASYAEPLLHGGEHPNERACLHVVARWLERPDDTGLQHAVDAEIEREAMLVMGEQDPITFVWDVARAARIDLTLAARYARRVAAHAGGWLNPAVSKVDRARGRRVEADRAEESAALWQIAAARAILAGQDPPPPPALPDLLGDPAQYVAWVRRDIDPHSAYARGDIRALRLLLLPRQEQDLAGAEHAAARACAAALLPPQAEDCGERACLIGGQPSAGRPGVAPLFKALAAAEPRQGLLRDALAALASAQIRRHQAAMAEAIAGAPAARGGPAPLTGLLADYRAGSLGGLCARLDAAGLQALRRALVGQALWYAMQVLPGPAGDRGHLGALISAEAWIAMPGAAPPDDEMGPAPAGASLESALAWNAARGVTLVAQAPDAQTLTQALHSVVAATTAALTHTTATGPEAEAAAYVARDYQVAVAMRIISGQEAPYWIGPDDRRAYSAGSIDAFIRSMGEPQQGELRLALIRACCAIVLRGLDAHAEPSAQLARSRGLTEAIRAWAARTDAAPRQAALTPDAELQAARSAATGDLQHMVERLALALSIAGQPRPSHAQICHVTRQVAEQCERAASFAAAALAERWQLDAAYALITDATLPPPPALGDG